jgi:cytochrome P450
MDKGVLERGVFLTLLEPAHVDNPYLLFRQLRSEAPFYWDFVLCGWFLTRYADIKAALIDPRLTTKNFPFDVSQLPRDLQTKLAPLHHAMNNEIFHIDGAEHDRLRRPMNRAFNPAAFERLRSKLELRAQQLLATAERRRSIEVVAEYSWPLANYMVGELWGLSPADRARFIRWCDQLRDFIMAPRLSGGTIAKAENMVATFRTLRAQVSKIAAVRRAEFKDDLIGRACAVEADELPPTDDEILSNCVFLVHTGARNLAASITNALVSLLQHPKEFARLRENPHLIATAIEELLRYENPVQVATRGVPVEMDLSGRRIGPKHLLVLLLGAANRDPEQFAHPDQLDLTRQPNHHLSFGLGPHGCIGARMVRFGVRIALEAIFRRNLQLRFKPGKLQWNLPAMRRTVHALPLFVDRPLQNGRRLLSKMAFCSRASSSAFPQKPAARPL